MNLPRQTVVIIGGGFSGTMLAIQILRRCPEVSISIVDKGQQPGRGLAYGTEYHCQLLNVPAGNMSAFPDQPDHFLKWARSNHDASIQTRSFLPRALYGRYLESLFEEARQWPDRQRLQWIQDEVLSLRRDSRQVGVQLRNGEELRAHVVVLATGNFPPGNPRIPGLPENSGRYVPFAWTTTALEGLTPDASVLLIGSGLTSLDLVIALKSKAFQGPIHIISRRGLMPQRQHRTDPWPLFWNEKSPRTTLGLLRLIRAQVRSAAAAGVDWRAVVDCLRPVTQQIWQSLSIDERRRFLRHVRSYWEVHRHRVAPEIGDVISDLIDDGQVNIHAGRVIKYLEGPAGALVTYRSRRTGHLHHLRVDRVINCTGSENDCRRIDSSLITSLFAQGLARPDALAMGLDVDFDGALVDSAGFASQTLYAVGPARKGCLWETTAVPEIRRQVADLAEHLAKSIFPATEKRQTLMSSTAV